MLWKHFFNNEIACEQAHICGHTRERQRANIKWRKRFGGAESGEEAQVKWACPDLCNFFISASPERSEIPLVEKRERRENCQSILFEACISNVLSKFQSVSSLNFELKKEQETAVNGFLMGRDVLAFLPTGYGKSFIFQTYVIASKQINSDTNASILYKHRGRESSARSDSCTKHKCVSRETYSFLEVKLRRLRRKTYEDNWYDIRDKNLPTACKQL